MQFNVNVIHRRTKKVKQKKKQWWKQTIKCCAKQHKQVAVLMSVRILPSRKHRFLSSFVFNDNILCCSKLVLCMLEQIIVITNASSVPFFHDFNLSYASLFSTSVNYYAEYTRLHKNTL